MNLTIVFLIFDRDAFFGSSASTRSLILLATWAVSSVLFNISNELLLPCAALLQLRAYFAKSAACGVSAMAPRRSPVAARFLVVDSDEIALIRDCALILFMM